MKRCIIIRCAVIALGMMSVSQAALLSAGDKIGIDLGPMPTTNWNNITSNNGGVAIGSVVNLEGVVIDGLSITTSNSQFTNNDGSNNWVGLSSEGGSAPVEFVDTVTTDISGNFNLGDDVPYTVTIAGLPPGFTYDLVAVTSANFTRIDTISVNGGEPSPVIRADAQANGLFHSFSNISANEDGQLIITVVDTGASVNPILNGVLITAVSSTPESVLTATIRNGVSGGFDFEWNSAPDKIYDLLSSTDLSVPVENWEIYSDSENEYEDLASGGATTTLTGVEGDGSTRFFVIREKTAALPQ